MTTLNKAFTAVILILAVCCARETFSQQQKEGKDIEVKNEQDTTLEDAIIQDARKIQKTITSGLIKLIPAGKLSDVLKEIPSSKIKAPLATNENWFYRGTQAPLVPDNKTTERTTTSLTTDQPDTTTSVTTDNPDTTSSVTTDNPDTTTSVTTDNNSTTTEGPVTETTTVEPGTSTVEPGSSTVEPGTPTARPDTTTAGPTASPSHKYGLSKGEIAALVIFIIILFTASCTALIYYIRKRRMSDESYSRLVN